MLMNVGFTGNFTHWIIERKCLMQVNFAYNVTYLFDKKLKDHKSSEIKTKIEKI